VHKTDETDSVNSTHEGGENEMDRNGQKCKCGRCMPDTETAAGRARYYAPVLAYWGDRIGEDCVCLERVYWITAPRNLPQLLSCECHGKYVLEEDEIAHMVEVIDNGKWG
jgi:hypothetical protein